MIKEECFEQNKKFQKITNEYLSDMLVNYAIRRITLVEDEKGKWQIVVVANWRAGELYVVTHRGGIRSWSSIDRLLKHLKKYQVKLPPIRILPRLEALVNAD